jgi:hypothetical protein
MGQLADEAVAKPKKLLSESLPAAGGWLQQND